MCLSAHSVSILFPEHVYVCTYIRVHAQRTYGEDKRESRMARHPDALHLRISRSRARYVFHGRNAHQKRAT